MLVFVSFFTSVVEEARFRPDFWLPVIRKYIYLRDAVHVPNQVPEKMTGLSFGSMVISASSTETFCDCTACAQFYHELMQSRITF